MSESSNTEELGGQTQAQSAPASLPTIAIVGRPNVGKSSLFNAILGRRQAIVLSESGITRDRVASSGAFEGCRFNLIDTGGLGTYAGAKRNVDFWDKAIAKQVEAAIDDAFAILFVVDVQAGPHALDQEVATRLRASGKKVVLVANKCDNEKLDQAADEFESLGFGKIRNVSCLHRRGIRELMAQTLEGVKPNALLGPDARRLKIAVVGRPNVGKSSLVNKLLGAERVIVSDVPGTTRDAIDIDFTLKCNDEEVPATLIDTAGLRKRSKVDLAVEKFSVMRAEEALAGCDIALFVVEADQYGATSQDKTIARLVSDSGRGCIIIANKWDACSGLKQKNVLDEFRHGLHKMLYAPIVFTCALSGLNFKELFEAIAQVRAQMSVKISTGMVNRVIGDAVERNLPPVVGLKPFKIYYGTMLFNPPPTFALFVNDPKCCSDNYRAYLERYFRTSFEFTGFPIRLLFKERPRLKKGEKGPRTLAMEKEFYSRDDDPFEDEFDDAPVALEQKPKKQTPPQKKPRKPGPAVKQKGPKRPLGGSKGEKISRPANGESEYKSSTPKKDAIKPRKFKMYPKKRKRF